MNLEAIGGLHRGFIECRKSFKNVIFNLPIVSNTVKALYRFG